MLGSATLAAAFLAACGGDETDEPTSGPSATSTPASTDTGVGVDAATSAPSTRMVSHIMGEVEIPADPQRVVIFDSTVTDILDLDVPLVGARNLAGERRYFPEYESRFAPIFDLGSSDLDLEDVINLRPDLILGSEGDEDIYDRASQIAPTVLRDRSADIDYKANWHTALLYHAEVLNREERATQLLADWEARTEHFKSRLAELGLNELLVSVVNISRSEIRLQTRGQVGGVLEQAGLKRPPAQALSAQETQDASSGGDTERYPISFERLRDADGDIIFIIGGTQSEEHAKTHADLLADPLWSQLNAVQQGRVFEVESWWNIRSRHAADRLLDDLYRLVLEEDPA